MAEIRKIIMLALAERAKLGIKVRQPLSKLKIKNQKEKIKEELLGLIKEEVNVKEVVFDPSASSGQANNEVELDTEITDELKKEGEYRELTRCIKAMRKELKLSPNDKVIIETTFSVSDMEKFKTDAGAERVEIKTPEKIGPGAGLKKEIKLDGETHFIVIKKV